MEDTIITFNSRTLWLRPDGDDSTLRLHLRTVEGQVSFVFITSTNRHIHGLTCFFFFYLRDESLEHLRWGQDFILRS